MSPESSRTSLEEIRSRLEQLQPQLGEIMSRSEDIFDVLQPQAYDARSAPDGEWFNRRDSANFDPSSRRPVSESIFIRLEGDGEHLEINRLNGMHPRNPSRTIFYRQSISDELMQQTVIKQLEASSGATFPLDIETATYEKSGRFSEFLGDTYANEGQYADGVEEILGQIETRMQDEFISERGSSESEFSDALQGFESAFDSASAEEKAAWRAVFMSSFAIGLISEMTDVDINTSNPKNARYAQARISAREDLQQFIADNPNESALTTLKHGISLLKNNFEEIVEEFPELDGNLELIEGVEHWVNHRPEFTEGLALECLQEADLLP